MAHLMTACSIENDTVVVNPIHLLHRLIIVGERESNLRQCFELKMTPYPMSLFKKGVMHKPDKPSLYSEFMTGLQASKPAVSQYVVDGGYLLHKVRWKPSIDMRDVLPLFSNYLLKYASITEGYLSCSIQRVGYEHEENWSTRTFFSKHSQQECVYCSTNVLLAELQHLCSSSRKRRRHTNHECSAAMCAATKFKTNIGCSRRYRYF